MSESKNDDLSFLEDLEGLTEQNSADQAPKKKASFRTEKLEERVLFSATWIDADTGEEANGASEGDDVFTGSSDRDVAYGNAETTF